MTPDEHVAAANNALEQGGRSISLERQRNQYLKAIAHALLAKAPAVESETP